MTRVLGLDEISIKKRHKQFALIISDIDRRCILDVLPVRDKEALEKWIDKLYVPPTYALFSRTAESKQTAVLPIKLPQCPSCFPVSVFYSKLSASDEV
ncbi:MAG: transposase [bacterium]|nr:transposase [bacterium]